jgi:predicted ribosomally synthesized peptide with nif11-like leader
MTIESAKAFIERMQTDKDLAKKIIYCKDWETARTLLSGEGYNFTFDELISLQDELSDEALEDVSGGTYTMCIPVCYSLMSYK